MKSDENEMAHLPSIAIVGGGPAGLTAAVILHQQGFRVAVYENEASRNHRIQGGTLDLHGDSGQLALERAGLLQDFRAIARHNDQETRQVHPLTGLVLDAPIGPDDDMDRPEIDRGELRDLLLSTLPPDMVHWEARLSHIAPQETGAHQLHFANGAIALADIVIGADGAWSKVRRTLSAVAPYYTGTTFFEGWIDAPDEADAQLIGNGTMFAFGGLQAIIGQKNGKGRICIYAAVNRSRAWIDEHIQGADAAEILRDLYAGWAPGLRSLLASCDAFSDRPIYTLPPAAVWSETSGVALVGDSAHLMPPVGVGVNLAMLDASDMALAIANAGDWRFAIASAQTRIRERAEAIMPDAISGFQEWFEE